MSNSNVLFIFPPSCSLCFSRKISYWVIFQFTNSFFDEKNRLLNSFTKFLILIINILIQESTFY